MIAGYAATMKRKPSRPTDFSSVLDDLPGVVPRALDETGLALAPEPDQARAFPWSHVVSARAEVIAGLETEVWVPITLSQPLT